MGDRENLCTASLKKESENFDSNSFFTQEIGVITNRLHGWEHNTTTNILIQKYNNPTFKSLQPLTQPAHRNLTKNYRFSKSPQNLFLPTQRKLSNSVKNQTFLNRKIINSKGYLASRINVIRKNEILKSLERNTESGPELNSEVLRKNIIIHSILPEKFKVRRNFNLDQNNSNLFQKRFFIDSYNVSGNKEDF